MVDTISARYHASEHQHRTLTLFTVQHYFHDWRDSGLWLSINHLLVDRRPVNRRLPVPV